MIYILSSYLSPKECQMQCYIFIASADLFLLSFIVSYIRNWNIFSSVHGQHRRRKSVTTGLNGVDYTLSMLFKFPWFECGEG